MKQLRLCILAVTLLGCGPTLAFTRMGDALPPKPGACEVAVLTAIPPEPYQELGTIEIKYSSQTAWIDAADDFKKAVQPTVCYAGGDAVIGHTNDYGIYLSATVLSLHAPSAPAAKAASAATAGGEGDATASPTP